jgi:uncharacterized integral membrane protein
VGVCVADRRSLGSETLNSVRIIIIIIIILILILILILIDSPYRV